MKEWIANETTSEKYLIELKKQGVVTPRRTDGRKVYYTEEDLKKLDKYFEK